MALVTVIVPVHNAERYLKCCLDSILDQDHPEIEILLVDDASDDGSGRICDEYASSHSSIKVFHVKNRSAGLSRNTGLANAHGDFVTFVDADDYISKHYVSAMLSGIEKYGADAAECGNVYMLPLKNILRDCDGKDVFLKTPEEIKKNDRILRHTAWGRLYPREMAQSVSFSEREKGEDAEYAMAMAGKCRSLVMINSCLYAYRSYQPSITRKKKNNSSILKIKNDIENGRPWKDAAEKLLEEITYCGEEEIYYSSLKKLRETVQDKDPDERILKELDKTIEAGNTDAFKRMVKILKGRAAELVGNIKTKTDYRYKL